MTTIIARKNDNGTVDLAWDSQSTGMGTAVSEKVFQVNEQFWVGVAGRTRYSNVLGYIDVPPIHPSDLSRDDFDVRGYLITQVVPAWVEGLDKQFGRVPDQKEDWPDGMALIIIKGRIFQCSFDFTIVESDREFRGIGSGSEYAIGAMAVGKSVKKAIEVAAELDLYTGGELKVMKGLK